MATATLSDVPATQLTFPWALPKAECEANIVADRSRQAQPRKAAPRRAAARPSVARPAAERPLAADGPAAAAVAEPTLVPTAAVEATSVQEALVGDRLGQPFRIGAVMFRLLKSYGITDEEIAEGIAAYAARRA